MNSGPERLAKLETTLEQVRFQLNIDSHSSVTGYSCVKDRWDVKNKQTHDHEGRRSYGSWESDRSDVKSLSHRQSVSAFLT